jgi:hypothetical protein
MSRRKWYCDEAREIVRTALHALRVDERPLPQDITNQVFLIIERDTGLHRQYNELTADGHRDAVNNAIGSEVIKQTGAKRVAQSRQGCSSLISSYGVLEQT